MKSKTDWRKRYFTTFPGVIAYAGLTLLVATVAFLVVLVRGADEADPLLVRVGWV